MSYPESSSERDPHQIPSLVKEGHKNNSVDGCLNINLAFEQHSLDPTNIEQRFNPVSTQGAIIQGGTNPFGPGLFVQSECPNPTDIDPNYDPIGAGQSLNSKFIEMPVRTRLALYTMNNASEVTFI